jgi:two-component system chemotaxis sensor kinase CheA
MRMSDELDEIQAIFFEECAEGLTTAEQGLSQMAAGDTSSEIIAGVFRAVHSIKGGSGAFGHAALLAFSHRFENVLDEVRAGRIPPTAEVTRVMLTAFDVLSDHVAAAQTGGDAPNDANALVALDALLASKGCAVPTPTFVSAPDAEADEFGFVPVAAAFDDFDPFGFEPLVATLEELDTPAPWCVRFVPSCAAMANGAEPLLVIRELEGLGGTVDAVDCSRLPNLRDLDPEAAYLGWTLRLPGTVAEADLLECFDFVDPDSEVEIAREIVETAGTPSMIMPNAEEEALQPLLDAEVSTASVLPLVATATVKAEKPADISSAPQTIRVDLPKLDLLLNLVGELVIRNSILSDRLSPKDQERAELPELARLTRQIQDNVMSLRAQPIRQAFSRVPRMLRDLCAETGKQIQLETIGEGTEIDKGVIEKIGDPLTHMIRNAADHGIESPDERAAKGKPREGTIRLSAEQKGARILVRVADDGRGIDRVRVRAKAVEKGIISGDAELTDEEIDQLICAPGFSTAEVISNISGRGVGMDVVRSNVEALGGRVEINSTPGKGTTFTMILPLTLAILDGMIVRLSGQRLVLPLANVIEAVRPEPGQIRPMTPTSEVIELRGNYLPIRRLSETFCVEANDRRAPEDSLVIIVESESAGHVGLLVDSIDGRREVVIKSLDQNLHPIRGLSGATILGDGSIALILDVEALVADSQIPPRHPAQGLAA